MISNRIVNDSEKCRLKCHRQTRKAPPAGVGVHISWGSGQCPANQVHEAHQAQLKSVLSAVGGGKAFLHLILHNSNEPLLWYVRRDLFVFSRIGREIRLDHLSVENFVRL